VSALLVVAARRSPFVAPCPYSSLFRSDSAWLGVGIFRSKIELEKGREFDVHQQPGTIRKAACVRDDRWQSAARDGRGGTSCHNNRGALRDWFTRARKTRRALLAANGLRVSG